MLGLVHPQIRGVSGLQCQAESFEECYPDSGGGRSLWEGLQ